MAPDIRLQLCWLLFTAAAVADSTLRSPLAAIYTLHNVTIHQPFSRTVTALSHFDMSFWLNTGDQVKLTLEPNHDIFPKHGLTVGIVDQDGNIKQHSADRLAHKVYKGQAWTMAAKDSDWLPASWVRVNMHKDGHQPIFEGSFSIDGETHHIQTGRNYLQTRHIEDPDIQASHETMIMYRDSDLMSPLGRRSQNSSVACLHDDLHFNTILQQPFLDTRTAHQWSSMPFNSLFGKRQVDQATGGNSAGVSLVSTIGQTAGCPTTRKVALVGVAADCNYRSAFANDNETQQNIITQINTASAAFEDAFGFSLALANLTVVGAECPSSPVEATLWNQACSSSIDISGRLNAFSQWRGSQDDNNSHWTLVSTCATASAVGLAWRGQACVKTANTRNTTNSNGAVSGQETSSGANVVIRGPGVTEWQILAHETAHTWGAFHDCDSSACASSQFVASSQCCPLSVNTCDADARYIMNPTAMQGLSAFSPCTIGNVCSAIGRNTVRSSCLVANSDVATYTGPQCGNGIIEPGEECDCGGEAGCAGDSCCDPTTCRYVEGAQCDDRDDACCSSCRFRTAGSVCRASSGPCDPQEVCTGNSSACPADVTAPDGEDCGSGLRCASGQCTSRNQQCKNLMSAYSHTNSTFACDEDSCSLRCTASTFGRGVCYGLNQNFLDGTPCTGNGRCNNGRCQGATAGGQFRSWIDRNKPLFIGLVAGLGGFILLLFLCCLWSCCRGRKASKVPPPPPSSWSQNIGPGYYGPVPPPRGMQQWRPPSQNVRYA